MEGAGARRESSAAGAVFEVVVEFRETGVQFRWPCGTPAAIPAC